MQSSLVWRLLALLSLLAILALFWYGPIAQDEAFHDFADQRALLGIPHFWNVVSNLPFVCLGLYGLHLISRRARAADTPAWTVFALASVLIGLGSGWYHLAPDSERLVWDRLAMTLAFMSFFVRVLDTYLPAPALRHALWPALAAGLLSVLWWHLTGDLRPYALVQFLPMLLIPLILLLQVRPLREGTGLLWAVLAAYTLAKLLEWQDHAIHQVLGLSGHTLKHFAAALGVWFALLFMQMQGQIRRA